MTHSSMCQEIESMIKSLDFSAKLLKEPDNYMWIPNWLVENTRSEAIAFGIINDNVLQVFFTPDSCTKDSLKFTVSEIFPRCFEENVWDNDYENNQSVCEGCNVREILTKEWMQWEEPFPCITFFEEGYMFLFAGNKLEQRQLYKKIASLIALNNNNYKAVSRCKSGYLPSDRVSQLWLEILSGLSHDIRTPLSSIKGYATTLLRDDVEWDAESRKEQLNIIVQESDHLENFILRFFDSTTLNWKGDIELTKEKVSLPEMITKVISDSSYHIKQHAFTTLFPPNFPMVSADPLLLERVLRNIIENAVKYSNNNTLIAVKCEVIADEAVVSVADQGIGIALEHLNRLFEKFYRVDNGFSERHNGMGLGLPLARQIINNHGGRIWATSKVGEGTTFLFSLRCEQNERNEEEHFHEEE